MAFAHGRHAQLGIDPTGGTSYTDLSAYLNESSYEGETDASETTTFGNDDKTYIAGLNDATFSLSGFFDPTIDALLWSIKQVDGVSFRYRPAGAGAGLPEFTGQVILTSHSVSVSVDEAVTIEAELQISGGSSRAVQS